MNQNNYFSDITDLFLNAKNKEDIKINPHKKAAIREMLSYNIDQLKTKAEAKTNGEGFWTKWKYQIMGLPASLFAVVIVVMAFQNLNITIPTDAPVIEDVKFAEPREFDGFKPKPEPMVIDYGEYKKPEVKPVVKSTPISATPPAAKTFEPEADFSIPSSQTFVLPTNEADVAAPQTTSQPTNVTPIPASAEITPAPQPQVTQEIPVIMPSNPILPGNIDLTDQVITDNNTPEEESATTAPPAEINNVTFFKPALLYKNPSFDLKALEKIENPDNLNNVNVHYLNDSQAAVEVVTGGETRWYLFEEIAGTWTIVQKFD